MQNLLSTILILSTLLPSLALANSSTITSQNTTLAKTILAHQAEISKEANFEKVQSDITAITGTSQSFDSINGIAASILNTTKGGTLAVAGFTYQVVDSSLFTLSSATSGYGRPTSV